MKVEQHEIDQARIASIAMQEYGGNLTGIRFADEQGNLILDRTWHSGIWNEK